jgi:hypothetical protein
VRPSLELKEEEAVGTLAVPIEIQGQAKAFGSAPDPGNTLQGPHHSVLVLHKKRPAEGEDFREPAQHVK